MRRSDLGEFASRGTNGWTGKAACGRRSVEQRQTTVAFACGVDWLRWMLEHGACRLQDAAAVCTVPPSPLSL